MDELFSSSRFAQWCAEQRRPYEADQQLRAQALGHLVEGVCGGQIVILDGVDSPVSMRIKDHHRVDAFEMNSHWIGTAQDWTCPCCARSKFAISRIGNSGQILAKLVIHHDHMGDVLEAAFNACFKAAGTASPQVDGKRLVERIATAFAAYEEILVCEDCNNADAAASRTVETAPHFSFSPGQIRRFIRVAEHRPHEIDRGAAEEVWLQAKSAYELRMKLIGLVGEVAATDAHWYEPSATKYPVPVIGYGSSGLGRAHDRTILEWVNTETLVNALGPAKTAKTRNLSRWRTAPSKSKGPLPDNYLALLRSDPQAAKLWDGLVDTWRCPICRRSKAQIAYLGDKGKINFVVSQNRARGKWSAANRICGSCNATLMSLKLEITQQLGRQFADSYGFVGPDELVTIIQARPHGPHQIKADAAARLVDTIIARSK